MKKNTRSSRMKLQNTEKVNPQGIVDFLDFSTNANSPISNKIPITEIKLPESQPRKYFDPTKQKELVESVRKHGILQPLLVRPIGNYYELVAGERRYRAAKEIGLNEVPANIREMTDDEARICALEENLRREDLTPVDETQAILELLAISLNTDTKNVNSILRRMQDEEAGKAPNYIMRRNDAQMIIGVFERIGNMTWESFVKNRLPILKLPEDVLEAIQAKNIEYTKGIAIAKVKEDNTRSKLLNKAIDEKLSVSRIREEVRKINASDDELNNPRSILGDWYKAYQFMKENNSLADTEINCKIDKHLSQVERILKIKRE